MIGVQYAACGVLDARILLTSTAMGLLVTNILYSHSVLDRQADARMDKRLLSICGVRSRISWTGCIRILS